MATFAELNTRISRRIIDAPAAVVAEIPDLINDVIREAEDKHNFACMEKTLAVNTVAANGHTWAPFPTDFKAYRGKPFRTSVYGGEDNLKVFNSVISAEATVGSLAEGPPYGLVEGDPDATTGLRVWEVWPLPDGLADYDDGEYRIYVPYWRYLPNLSADSDYNWFTINGVQYIIARACAKGFELDWDMQNGPKWETLAADAWNTMKNADLVTQFSGQDTLQVSDAADNDVDDR